MIIKNVSHLLMVMLVALFSTSSKPHPATHLKDILPVPGGNYRPGMLTDDIDRFVNDDKKDKLTNKFKSVIVRPRTRRKKESEWFFVPLSASLPVFSFSSN